MTFSNSTLLEGNIVGNESEYSDKNAEVPFRNGLMIAVAASLALSIGAESIQFAVHAGESAGGIYADKRESFFRVMASAINEGTDGELKLELQLSSI